MASSSHILVCSDFDGTITLQDTGVMLFDHCLGKERRMELDECVFRGELPLRYAHSLATLTMQGGVQGDVAGRRPDPRRGRPPLQG